MYLGNSNGVSLVLILSCCVKMKQCCIYESEVVHERERGNWTKWSAICAILMSMSPSELVTGAVAQLRLQTHVVSPVTYF
jgi:hypothetical protein